MSRAGAVFGRANNRFLHKSVFVLLCTTEKIKNHKIRLENGKKIKENRWHLPPSLRRYSVIVTMVLCRPSDCFPKLNVWGDVRGHCYGGDQT